MRLTVIAKAAGITAATALLTVGTLAQAQASPSAGYIGDGYANNSHGVWCVQHLVNDVASAKGKGRPLAEDGLWGPNTKSWVTWYQGASGHGLSKDGIVGKGTGGWLLLDGDSYYGGYNYCYNYVPSYF
ncbi:peptidoglycan-binding protein [Kitasatospora sp. NPDC017646]|uniref:peptidoglycan-binding protein n=1 Tax=Kitasatospora sp. NPDC017646 TaxID=3364024 RepID=UPI0037AAB4C5